MAMMHKCGTPRAALLAATLAVAAAPALAAQARHDFRLGDSTFLLDGRPLQLISGEMHFARIPREYWHQRLRMAKALGLNAVATYVFWNYHETAPGRFDFRTGNRDLAAFVRAAQQEGLWVILRPGPYACAEWEFGGFPHWLLKERDLTVRTRDPRFLAAAERYVRAMVREILPLQVTHGGPVLMVQVENEYGSFGQDSAYKAAVLGMLTQAGVDVPLFTSDGDWLFAKGAIPGVLPTANGEANYDTLVRRVNAFNGGHGPYLVAEFYPGWLSHWAEPFPDVREASFLPEYENLLRHGTSVNLYMVHGGTNFGFTSGSNYTRQVPIQPSLTSYDYDAPISEAGWATPKYDALRPVIRRYATWPVPEVPGRPPVIALPEVRLRRGAVLAGLLRHADSTRADQPLTFEDLDQANGYVLYRWTTPRGASGTLDLGGLRDYGVVLVNGRRVAVLERRLRTFTAAVTVPPGGTLDILVENQGRINYGGELVNERKGIVSPVRIGDSVLSGWTMFRLPFDAPPRIGATSVAGGGVPALYHGTFRLARTGDTFLDMRGWGKGIVFVNGVNLGRYWDLGPQQTLYVPGPWLRRGSNEIVVFEQLDDGVPGTVRGLTEPILRDLRR